MGVFGRRAHRYTIGAAALGLALFKSSYPEDSWAESNAGQSLYWMTAACQGLVRSSRAIYTFTINSLDYNYSLRGYDYKSEEYYQIRSQVHLRAAKRILNLCEANRGFYIKAGQFVASIQHVPKEYSTTLVTLQDQATPCHFKAIKQVFRDNFGKDLSDIFMTFDEQPIAAASIAQVHHATLWDGQEVAVKVQYPGLQQQLRIDITTMELLSKAISLSHQSMSIATFLRRIPLMIRLFYHQFTQWRRHLHLKDFVQEAENAERTARNFKNNSVVKVPRIFWDLTTRQVLVMQFMHGCKVDDLQCLLNAGLSPTKVAQTLVEVFAEMIFVHGYVHGDPHPGNILVFPHKSGKHGFDIVLLDHGIYREFDEGFRADYCHLWKALILLDTHEMQHVGERLGAGKYYQYFPVIFTGRTIDSKSVLGKGMSIEERKRLRQEVRQYTMGDISQFMEGLPRDLLTILRTDGLLRSIISKLGAPQRIRLLANAKYAVAGLVTKHNPETGLTTGSLKLTIKASLDYVCLRLYLEILELHYKMGIICESILEQCKYWFSKFACFLADRISFFNFLL